MLYLTLVLFCTTRPFFRQTIIGAGALSAKHHKNEVWLYSTYCFVATLARIGVTELNKFHEINSVAFTMPIICRPQENSFPNQSGFEPLNLEIGSSLNRGNFDTPNLRF